MKHTPKRTARSTAKNSERPRRSLKKKVVATVAAAGTLVAIQIAPGCYYIYVSPEPRYLDGGWGDGSAADGAIDHPVYYVMAPDAGPPRDAAAQHDAMQPDTPVYYVMAWDAGHAPDGNVAQDHPVYYIMAQDGGPALDIGVEPDHPIYYVMALDAGQPVDGGAADNKATDADLQDQPIYYIMAWDH